MRSVASRVKQLERLHRLHTGRPRIVIQHGYLKALPPDYTGPRHTVTVRQLPPDSRGKERFEWEERPGPGPSEASNANDDIVVHVCSIRVGNPLWTSADDLPQYDDWMSGHRGTELERAAEDPKNNRK